MSTISSPAIGSRALFQPFFVGMPFSVVVTGLAMSNNVPPPVAWGIGAAWGLAIGLAATWVRERKPLLSAWLEDGLAFLGATVMGFFSGGLIGLLTLQAALQSPSITGETLVLMFLPAVPYFIVVNSTMELLVVPGLIYLGWRAGTRRILIVIAAVMYFAFRVWSYLYFVPNRLAFAELEGGSTPFTAAERRQAYNDLQLDDPRWILGLPIMAVVLLILFFSRVRELRATSPG